MAHDPILPPPLVDALTRVAGALEHGRSVDAELKLALDLLAGLPPAAIAQMDGPIARAADLRHRVPAAGWRTLLGARPSDADRLMRTPELAWLFLFHRDGRLREAALLRITGGVPTPFLFAAILWRLNDWAAPVRAAAARCAARCFPVTDADVIARAAMALLVRHASWRRWDEERAVLHDALARPDVAARLAALLIDEANGPLASVLRHAWRTPAIDDHLERIAAQAVQPAVRAAALGALIDAKVSWPSGTAWRWIDKSMGVRQRVQLFEHRALTDVPAAAELIARGVADRSPVVRRVALTGVIRHLLGTSEARAIATPLLGNRSPSVREKAVFILGADVAGG